MNRDLLQQIYERFSREILIYLYSLSGNRQIAEDLTQETFLKALLALPDEHGKMRAWLYKVARNLFINHCRRNPTTVGLEAAGSVPDGAKGAEEVLLSKLSSKKLYEAVLRLDRQKREVILLQYFSQFSQAQIADVLGISPANVRVLSHRAKKELKKIMEENEDEIL